MIQAQNKEFLDLIDKHLCSEEHSIDKDAYENKIASETNQFIKDLESNDLENKNNANFFSKLRLLSESSETLQEQK